jgi:hypothetical protein
VTTHVNSPLTRTLWAERHVEDFLSLPLVSEFVFRSPQTVDGGVQREVADFLVTCGKSAILISQKCQEDPLTRTRDATAAWALKRSRKGVSQLCGALRTGRGKALWCDHPRRGRVDFQAGLPPIAHGIVLVEVFQPVPLTGDPLELPLEYDGTPITYLSRNDFLNLALQLRTLPELLEYLDKRRVLPYADLRTIGAEDSLYAFYVLNDGCFDGCMGIADARIAVAGQTKRLKEALQRKADSDRYGSLLERVADSLASRHPDYAKDIPAEVANLFDPPDQRRNYLELQLVLANLRLRERAVLGFQFHKAAEKLRNDSDGFVYSATYLDSQPDWVYVLASSRNVARPAVLSRMWALLRAAMAHYGKSRSLVVTDRSGESFEVMASRPGFKPTITDFALGERLFGTLRVEHRQANLIPEEGTAFA